MNAAERPDDAVAATWHLPVASASGRRCPPRSRHRHCPAVPLQAGYRGVLRMRGLPFSTVVDEAPLASK